jgi:hypothetical protein
LVKSFTIKDDFKPLLNKGKDVVICEEYFYDKYYSKFLGSSISIIIIVVNLILKTAIIRLIQWIGEDTVSQQLASITNGVFYA